MGRSVHAPLFSAVLSSLAASADLRRRLLSFVEIRIGSSHALDPAALPVAQFTTPCHKKFLCVCSMRALSRRQCFCAH
ncbi:uncharacterized protein M421DRAFT_426416 [Didymella exigua CBS 183.55]|uniref:Uncharacterized protein n=1 Tax=Didymella exigua CBS 183.55 TaxID=1150837 RepID=A0A6A5R5M8_9PLEO|nr:uncharacterized protein M421DRAFT_426416 [Didymella exigua CBS 183.55]KAF1922923.1 hypothetical protein M421DRAFT_426416 [Didymella exigua CBS 183.55]